VVQIFEKRTFEMQADGFNESLNALQTRGRNQIILCGIEAHVCVLQTALRQLEKGLDVYVVCDAVSSQR
jgi:isochorismate hydrolase